MRWDQLFADLEGQIRDWERSERDAEIADRTRGETGHVLLANRLRRQVGEWLQLSVVGAGRVDGTLSQVGAGWLLLDGLGECVVPLEAVTTVVDLSPAAVTPDAVGQVASRLGLTSALRAIAVDRCPVRMTLRDASEVVGTPQRVGADFVDIERHDVGELARRGQVRGTSTVPFAALGLVRRLSASWG